MHEKIDCVATQAPFDERSRYAVDFGTAWSMACCSAAWIGGTTRTPSSAAFFLSLHAMVACLAKWGAVAYAGRTQATEGMLALGIKVSDEELATLVIERDEFHGEWNYRLRSRDKHV